MPLVTYNQVPTQHGPIGQLVLSDPDNLNAMSEQMAQEFKGLVSSLSIAQEKPRAIVLTGAGRAFSAGGDLAMLDAKRHKSLETNRAEMLTFYSSFLSMLTLRVPLIAAINGPAVGAGLCIAAACDIRLASNTAKLGFTFTKLGLHPGMGATYFLPRVVGEAMARELMLTARMIGAEEALRIGLVSKMVEPTALVAEALKVAEEIASCGSLATQQLVASLRGDQSAQDAALSREAECQSINYRSAEFAERVHAAQQKKKAT